MVFGEPGSALTPGGRALAHVRQFQAAVRGLYELSVYSGRQPDTGDYYYHEHRHRALQRTDEEWYALARTAAHIARKWRLVE